MRTLVLSVLLVTLALFSCERFDEPPQGTLVGGPVLSDGLAPLVVRFQKPIDPDTLKLKIITYDVDMEGNLADETDAGAELKPLFRYDPREGEAGGTLEVIDGDTAARIRPNARLPIGRKLAIVIEPGLASKKGVVTTVRDKILFSYDFKCSGKGTRLFKSGPYMFILDVESPIGVQIQLFAQIRVDPVTGTFVGQFTNADRNTDDSRCGDKCTSADACRTIPSVECVAPSLRAASVDEFPDYVPNVIPPTGYSFLVQGCAEDQSDTVVAIGTAPTDLVVQQPAVSARALVVLASFENASDGVFRATGTGTADQILLGDKPFGQAKGTVTARDLPLDRVPNGVPLPP